MASSCCRAPGQLHEDPQGWLSWICTRCGAVLATLAAPRGDQA